MSNHLCVHATIHGRVQGVGFRSWVERKAAQRDLTGWVKNRSDSTVEALFCGDATQAEEMLKECEQGPAGANVLRVDRKMPDMPPPKDFKQLATE